MHTISSLHPTLKALRRCIAPALLGCLAVGAPAQAAGLNDTGQTTCADAAGETVSCTAVTAVQGQDARYGRDAAAGTSALIKSSLGGVQGGGANGFDFVKISNAGAPVQASTVLGSNPGDWGCTYDNTTGLMWEVKTTSGLRSQSHTYTWYSSNSATNGGAAGTATGGTCFTTGRCDTEKFVQDVNATNMCGHSDWRMPTFRELQGLVRLGVSPAIDGAYFPYTVPVPYWSGSPYASYSSLAWLVYFGYGYAYYDSRSNAYSVRLVRGGQ